jgi:hypothetical protein
MKTFTGADTMPLFARVAKPGYDWLEQEAARNNVSRARMLSRILLEKMSESNRSAGII